MLQLSAAMNHEENSAHNGVPGSQPQLSEAALAQTLGVQHNLPQLSQSLAAQQNQLGHQENVDTTELSNLISSIGLIPGLNTGQLNASQLNAGQLGADPHLASQLGGNQLNNSQFDVSALQASLQAQGNSINPMLQPQLPANLQQQLANISLPQGSLLGQTQNLPINTMNAASVSSGLQRPQNQSQTQPLSHLNTTNSGPTAANQNRSEQISTDALISSLLMPNSAGINLSNINLNNINLKEISLDTLTYISNTLGSNAAKQASSIGNSNSNSNSLNLPSQQSQSHSQSQPRQHLIHPPQFPQLRRRTSSFIDRERLNNEIQAALDDVRLQELPPAPSVTQTEAGASAASDSTLPSSVRPPSTSSGGLSQDQTTSRNRLRKESFSGIDPDVSTIQSVLQSLLSGGSSGSQPAAGSSSHPPPPFPDATESQSANTSQKGDSTGGFDISSLGLGSEDQSLIDSLRSVFDGSARPSGTDPSGSLTESLAKLSQQSDSSVVDERGRLAPKPKRARITGPSSRSGPYSDYSSKYKYQSDYTAADPDTLRAIQQALLGALDTSSSASLADSSSAVSGASSSAESLKRAMDTPGSQSAKAAAAVVAAAADRASTSARRSTPVESIDDAEVSRLNKQRLVENKKKVREDNAARKRRWREVNLLQNRDNDLRARILKRGIELYGPGDTPAKSKWIEEEFNRRRQRRILRAGINSIVESARARHAKAQEFGAADGTSDQSLVKPTGTQQGTLSQQSKQAASSHLSKLFKSSNAALEQHLYTGKLSVPIVPYMLVPFPKRPSYKIPDNAVKGAVVESSEFSHVESDTQQPVNENKDKNNTKDKSELPKEDHINQSDPPSEHSNEHSVGERATEGEENSDKKDHQGSETSQKDKTTEESRNTASNTVEEREESKKNSDNEQQTEAEPESEAEPETVPEKDASDNLKSADDTTKEERSKKDSATNELTPTKPAKNERPETGTEETAALSTEESERYNEASDRPKHRYTLVGNVRLGVPPNLTAIYRKLKGSLKH